MEKQQRRPHPEPNPQVRRGGHRGGGGGRTERGRTLLIHRLTVQRLDSSRLVKCSSFAREVRQLRNLELKTDPSKPLGDFAIVAPPAE